MENENKKATEADVVNDNVVTGESLLRMDVKKLPYLVEGLFPKVGIATLAGSSDTGKSSILRQLAIGVARGDSEFLGFKLNLETKSALYVSTEDDAIATAYLLKKNLQDTPPEKLKSLGFIFDTEGLCEKLDKALTKSPADLVIVDAFGDIYSGEMNAANKVRSFLTQFSSIAGKHKCLIVFLHHTSKRTDYLVPSKDNLLGSQGYESKMRLAIEFRKDYDHPELRHLCIVKGNYVPDSEKDSSYVLQMDSNMVYSNTGARKPFNELVRQAYTGAAKVPYNMDEICECKKKGMSLRKTEEFLAAKGVEISKSQIGILFQRCPNVQPLSDVDNGQSEEAQETEEVQAKGSDEEE